MKFRIGCRPLWESVRHWTSSSRRTFLGIPNDNCMLNILILKIINLSIYLSIYLSIIDVETVCEDERIMNIGEGIKESVGGEQHV
jgi:hypothetical protein